MHCSCEYRGSIWCTIQQKCQLAQGTVASGHIRILQHGMHNSGQPTIIMENMTESMFDEDSGVFDRVLQIPNSFIS